MVDDRMALLTYTVKIEAAKVYKVRCIEPCHTAWANATVRAWPGGGSIDIQSDYGSYAHSWSSIGDGSFLSFLWSLNYDYFMTKTRGDYRQFDAEGAVARIKRDIVDGRRQGDLNKEQARDLFNEADAYDTSWQMSAEALGNQFSNEMYSRWAGDFPMVTRDNPETRGFWDRVWPMLTDVWRKEESTRIAEKIDG